LYERWRAGDGIGLYGLIGVDGGEKLGLLGEGEQGGRDRVFSMKGGGRGLESRFAERSGVDGGEKLGLLGEVIGGGETEFFL
jgi:hypothetical protein